MSALRASAVSLLSAIVLTLGAPLYAAAGGHPTCVAKQHDCGKTARLVQCCCQDGSDHANDQGPVPPRVDVTPVATIAAIAVVVEAPKPQPSLTAPIDTSPPGLALADLQVLFATFLI